MATTESRLEDLKAKSEKRLYKKKVYDAGFDHADDYEAWKLLNDLRDLTFKERKAAMFSDPAKGSGVKVSGGIFGGVSGGSMTIHPTFTVS